jgi:hypothetical protein
MGEQGFARKVFLGKPEVDLLAGTGESEASTSPM